MKYIFVILALMPFVRGQEQRSISGQLREAIEALRDRMPCGFPEYGLPPLAPYKTEHAEINIDTDALQAYGEVNAFRLYGLNDFDIVNLRLQTLLSRITFEFNWNNVTINTNYNATTSRGDMGLRRSGAAKLNLKDFKVWGIIKYKLGIVSQKITVKELRVYVSLGQVKSEVDGLSPIGIINKKLNRIIEEWIMLAVNDNTDNVASFTNSMILPMVNNFLSDKTLSDLLAMAGSGGQQEPCIAPVEEY